MFRHLAGCLLLVIFNFPVHAQCPISVSAGTDVLRCNAPSSVQLNGSISGDYLGFTWSPTAGMSGATTLNPSVNVSQSTNYILTATALDASINLITNGDFEQGVTGFSSDYINSPGDLWPESVFDVLPNPNAAHTNFPACGDHTTGGGNMMAVNGAGTVGVDVWCQTVTVSPNTQYAFTAWATSLVAASPARLQFSINGTNLGTIFNVSSQTCDWQNFYAIWNSGSQTSATICIVNQNSALSGNDFAIDDIVFSPVCRVSDTVRVQVVNLNAMAAPTAILPCEGATFTLNGTGSSVGPGIMYEWTTMNGNIVSGENTLNPVIDSPGSYTLRVSFVGANGEVCERFTTVTAFYAAIPLTALISPPPQLGCGASAITLVGNAQPNLTNITYQWSIVNNGNIVGSTTSKNCAVNQPGTYQLQVTNSVTGCTSTAQVTVTAQTSLPTAQATADTIDCTQATAVLSGAGSSTGAGISYLWTTSNGTIVSGQNSQNAVAGTAGTYILAVTNTASACVVRDTVVVISNTALPFSSIDPPEFIDCDSDTIELFVNLSPPPFVLLVWTATNGGNIASGQFTPNPRVTSSGTYILQTTDPLNGCVSIDTVAVTTNYAPPTAVSLPADSLSCQQNSVVLSGAGSSTGANFGYEWSASPGGNIVSGAQTLNPVVNASGTYTLTVLNYLNGCTASSTALVVADTNAVTAVTQVSDTLDCTIQQVALSAAGSTSGPAISYTWSTSNGLITSGAATPDPIVAAPGIYLLTLTNTANGCSSTSQVEVMQDTLAPEVQIPVPAQITCALPIQSITAIPVQSAPVYTYTWTAGSGGTIVSGNGTPSINVNAAATYSVLVSSPSNGCSSTYNSTVTQEAGIPIATTNVPGPITCADTTISLSGAGSSTGSQFVYTWTAAAGGHIVSGNTSLDPVVNAAGTYILQIINQSNGCTASDTLAVTEDTTPPPAIAGQGSVLTCASPVSQLHANENEAAANLNFQWSTATGHFTGNPNDSIAQVDVAAWYYLSVLNTQNGCTALDSVEITENKQVPSLSFAPPAMLTCAVTSLSLSASATGSTAVLPAFHWQTGTGNILSGDSTATPLVNAPGSYALTVTDPANGCTVTGGALVSQNTTAPPIDILPANILSCALTEQLLQGENAAASGNFSYAWSAGNGGNIVAGDTALQATVDAPGRYVLTAINLDNGCQTLDSVDVQENIAAPLADAGLSDTLNCLNNSLTISGTASGQGALTYLWTAVSGNITAGANTLSPTVNQAGLYRLQVIELLNGCSVLDSVEVLQDANVPQSEAGPTFTLNCVLTQNTLQGSGSSGAAYSYLWTTNNGNIVGNATMLNPVVDAPGTYFLMVHNASNGCSRLDSVSIDENLLAPAVAIAAPGLLTCSTQSLSLNAQAQVNGALFNWLTYDGNIVSGAASATPGIDEAGTYQVTVTDPANGCSSTASVQVNSDTQSPVLSVAMPELLTCVQTEIFLAGTVTQPNSNFSVQWTTNGGTFVSGQATTAPQVSAPGTYQMNVLNQLNGCNAFVSVVVQEDVLAPTALAAANEQITCDATVVALSAAGSSAGADFSYLWSGNSPVNAPTTPTPTVSSTGAYTLVVTDQSNGCTSSATATVSANTTPPVVALAVPLVLTCVRDSVLIDAGASSSGPAFQITWSTGNGHFSSGQNTLTPLVDEPGLYTLTIENSNNGCTATQSLSVLQNLAMPGAAVAPVSELHCNRPETNLAGSSPTAGSTFRWTTSTGQILSGDQTATPLIAAPGVYQVLVTNPVNGCTSVAQVNVAEAEAPEFLPIVWQPDCHLATGAVDFGAVSGGKSPFEYSVNGGQAFSSEASVEALMPGVYELVVRDAYGCTALETREIEAPFLPSVTLEGLHLLELGDSLQLLPVLNLPLSNIASWEWTPAIGLSCSDCPNPTAKPLEASAYTLIITDLNGCIAEARTQFRVNTNRVVYPPNIISPDGDGKNDYFNLFGKGVKDIRWMRIYDRWGNQLYDAEHLPVNDEMQGWNGVFRGQSVSPGVFVWQAMVEFIDGATEIFSGDVTVMR